MIVCISRDFLIYLWGKIHPQTHTNNLPRNQQKQSTALLVNTLFNGYRIKYQISSTQSISEAAKHQMVYDKW